MAHPRPPAERLCLTAGEKQKACWDFLAPTEAIRRFPYSGEKLGPIYEMRPGELEFQALVFSREDRRLGLATVNQVLAEWGIPLPTAVHRFEKIPGVKAEVIRGKFRGETDIDEQQSALLDNAFPPVFFLMQGEKRPPLIIAGGNLLVTENHEVLDELTQVQADLQVFWTANGAIRQRTDLLSEKELAAMKETSWDKLSPQQQEELRQRAYQTCEEIEGYLESDADPALRDYVERHELQFDFQPDEAMRLGAAAYYSFGSKSISLSLALSEYWHSDSPTAAEYAERVVGHEVAHHFYGTAYSQLVSLIAYHRMEAARFNPIDAGGFFAVNSRPEQEVFARLVEFGAGYRQFRAAAAAKDEKKLEVFREDFTDELASLRGYSLQLLYGLRREVARASLGHIREKLEEVPWMEGEPRQLAVNTVTNMETLLDEGLPAQGEPDLSRGGLPNVYSWYRGANRGTMEYPVEFMGEDWDLWPIFRFKSGIDVGATAVTFGSACGWFFPRLGSPVARVLMAGLFYAIQTFNIEPHEERPSLMITLLVALAGGLAARSSSLLFRSRRISPREALRTGSFWRRFLLESPTRKTRWTAPDGSCSRRCSFWAYSVDSLAAEAATFGLSLFTKEGRNFLPRMPKTPQEVVPEEYF